MASDEMKHENWSNPAVADNDKIGDGPAAQNAEHAGRESVADTSRELEALRAEIDRLRASIHEIASGSKRIATAEWDELKAAAEMKLTQNVFLSVGVAALAGYLWGRTRR